MTGARCDKITPMDIKQLARYKSFASHAKNNEIEILRSKQCGCFFCRKIYDARKVSQWTSEESGGASAVCPECGMNAVIGDASGIPLTPEVLKDMNEIFFGPETADEGAAVTYVKNYLDKKIDQTPANECLFEQHCLRLTRDTSDPVPHLLLGDFYSGMAKFHEPDFAKAAHYYSSPCLKSNANALCRLAKIYLEGRVKGHSKSAGFECLTKASALGSMEAVYQIIDCYLIGHPVRKDHEFAFAATLYAFQDLYPGYVYNKEHWQVMPDFALRLGALFADGIGTEKDISYALRYLLFARFALRVRNEMGGQGDDYSGYLPKKIGEITQTMGLKEGSPVFDADSFFDTYGDPNTPEDGPKKFILESHSESERTLDFTIESANPGFFFDLGNLVVGPAPGKITWHFTEVALFRNASGENFRFNLIRPHGDGDGWDLIQTDENGNSDIQATIRFTPIEGFDKIFKTARKKAKTPKKKGK